jgi:Tfp pilus assembly protein FimT
MTLVEVIVVSVVMAIVLCAALPHFSRTAQRLGMERSAADLAHVLRYAHARAVSQSQTIQARLNAKARRVELSVVGLDGSETQVDDRFGASQTVPNSADLQMAGLDGPISEIRFFADGTAQEAVLWIDFGVTRYTVRVDGATSQVVSTSGTVAR